MNLTTDVLKEHFGNLKVRVILQNELIREALITNEVQKPLLYAMTIYPNLKDRKSIDIWNIIKGDLFVVETIKSLGYTIDKNNIACAKARCPGWLNKLVNSIHLNYDVISYDLIIHWSENNFSKFAKIVEILLDNSLNELLIYNLDKNDIADELTKTIKNIYQFLKIKKQPIMFF